MTGRAYWLPHDQLAAPVAGVELVVDREPTPPAGREAHADRLPGVDLRLHRIAADAEAALRRRAVAHCEHDLVALVDGEVPGLERRRMGGVGGAEGVVIGVHPAGA